MLKSKKPSEIAEKLLSVLVWVSPFLLGGFHEWISCLLSVCLLACLLLFYAERRELRLSSPWLFSAAAVLALSFLPGIFWAVDKGMAPFGFVKFLPLPLFVLASDQIPPAGRDHILKGLPVSAAIMTILSFLLSRVPGLSGYFLVNRRLAGFFQYPNTYAIFLLTGLIILLFLWQQNLKCLILQFLMLGGILLSGSRTVLILLLLTVFASFLLRKETRYRFLLPSLTILLLALAGIYALVSGNISAVSRYLTISLSSSTFVGRLLYFRDALPVIAAHPLGLGYMGYYFSQGSFQTGIYHVLHIHNDLLQLLLDAGWIPAILCILAAVKGLLPGKNDLTGRLLCAAIILHSLFDFNLQFIAVCFILLLALNRKAPAADAPERALHIKTRTLTGFVLPAAVLFLVCIYFFTASLLSYVKRHEGAVKVYPVCSVSWIALLSQAETSEDMENIADRLLKLDPSLSIANSAKARTSYAGGDFANMILYKEKAIQANYLDQAEYLDYFDMLSTGVTLYAQHGDAQSAAYCLEKLRAIPDMMEAASQKVSALGKKIYDQPDLTFPSEYEAYLNALENSLA